MLGSPAQRRGGAAHALFGAGASGGAGGAEWARALADGTVRICVDGVWHSGVACPAAEWGSAAALARGALAFLAGCGGGPGGFALVAGALPVPGPAGGEDIDAAGELWGARDPFAHYCSLRCSLRPPKVVGRCSLFAHYLLITVAPGGRPP